MRAASRDVKRLLRAYDRRLAIVWDAVDHGWRLVYDGEPQREILLHEDGTPVYDLYLTELQGYLQRCDRQHHGSRWEREAYQQRRERQWRHQQRVAQHAEEGRREAQQVLRTVRRGGPRPQVHIQSRKGASCTPIRVSST